ncbi:hypothetical protein CBER1_03613 [Cercospora berteroae]|uniref:Aquaporin n=1 Tax=Cercospora berteroae TaxID=357750 RepID=A0A2S6C867_9PEZI|nr:hypothetical protein CBER1_03613 [Cercospora berteroae]
MDPNKTFVSVPGLGNKEEPGHLNEHRLPFIGFLPNRVRNHFIAMVGEFIGTFLFLFFAFSGTQVANAAAAGANAGSEELAQVPNAPVLMYIALAFGFSLAVNAWVFFRISGGLFNPAVTLGLAMIGAINWVRALLTFIAQILGAIASAAVVSALFPGPLAVSTNLSAGTSLARGLFIEMFLTAELVFTIFMLAAEKHKATFIAPVGIGLALFIAELSGVFFTGGSLNPARSFGPCVVLRSFPSAHWIYWLGPALGALLAVGFYRFVKVLEYETANPGQDFNEHEAEHFDFDEDNAATGADVARPVPTGLSPINSAASRDSAQQIPGFGDRLSQTPPGTGVPSAPNVSGLAASPSAPGAPLTRSEKSHDDDTGNRKEQPNTRRKSDSDTFSTAKTPSLNEVPPTPSKLPGEMVIAGKPYVPSVKGDEKRETAPAAKEERHDTTPSKDDKCDPAPPKDEKHGALPTTNEKPCVAPLKAESRDAAPRKDEKRDVPLSKDKDAGSVAPAGVNGKPTLAVP